MKGEWELARKNKILEKSNGHLTVEQQEKKKNAEVLASDGLPVLPERAPAYLSSAAQTEWNRVSKDLAKLPIRNLDRATLELYCTWYGLYKDVLKKMNKGPAAKRIEWVGFLDKITKNIKGCASDLGLTVDSRMRMYLPKDTEKKSLKDVFGEKNKK